MTEQNIDFEWVPFFEELAKKIASYKNRQPLLVELLKRSGVNRGLEDQNPEGTRVPLIEIDPFTFIALVVKHNKYEKRKEIFDVIKSELNMSSNVPLTYSGVPNAMPFSAWYFPYKYQRGINDVPLLWDIFEQVLNNKLTEEAFAKALTLPGVGMGKLTQGMFWVSPKKYIPVDGQTTPYLEKLGYTDPVSTASEYLNLCKRVLSEYKDSAYKLSYEAWKQNQDNKKPKETKKIKTIVNEKKEDSDNLRPTHMHQLNTILYGPPGTGKTYLTSRLAVEICNGSAPADEVALMEEYNKLKTTGRISFVTFHQSFSYEDFVEGIRPEVVDQQITYDVKSGVFKSVCELASNNKNLISASTSQKFKDKKLFKMSLGNSLDPDQGGIYQDCIDNNYVLLGWGGGLDYTGCNSISDVRKKYKESFVENEQDYNITSVHYLKNEMKVGDLVLISDGNTKFRAVGEISGEYKRINRDDGYVQMRPVKWIAQYKDSLPIESISSKRLSQMSIYLPDPKAINWDALEELLKPVERNYVLIIDEINRANISKVFGELITLIEKEKREQLGVTLPYSRSSFTIPKNLYIIGTMNTADRSIATLDTALRRRFSFKEMMPDISKLAIVDGVDLGQLLLEINKRILQLYDRDHTIGHAYLMNINSLNELNEAFKNKIIPLLQEYFYEDWEKLKLALNDTNNKFIVTESSAPIEGLDDIRKIYSVTKETLIAEDFISIYK